MATAKELLGRSAQANESSHRARPWMVYDAADETAAIAAVAAAAPSTLEGMVLRSIDVDEEVLEGWRCRANYGMFQKKEPPQTGESQFNFEINTQPVRRYAPIGSITTYGSNLPTIGLIGEQLDGGPAEGVDVQLPVHSESETHYLASNLITSFYKQQIKQLVGRTNNAPWKGHQTGEVLLAAVSGSRRGADDWEVTFRWLIQENESNLTVGSISGISRKGWQHLWPLYRPKKDSSQPYVVNEVVGVAVATVFNEGNMSLLGIGV